MKWPGRCSNPVIQPGDSPGRDYVEQQAPDGDNQGYRKDIAGCLDQEVGNDVPSPELRAVVVFVRKVQNRMDPLYMRVFKRRRFQKNRAPIRSIIVTELMGVQPWSLTMDNGQEQGEHPNWGGPA